MSRTLINWADLVWNFLIGCDRVSKGCDGCYAILDTWIRAHNPNGKIAAANAGLTRKDDGPACLTGLAPSGSCPSGWTPRCG